MNNPGAAQKHTRLPHPFLLPFGPRRQGSPLLAKVKLIPQSLGTHYSGHLLCHVVDGFASSLLRPLIPMWSSWAPLWSPWRAVHTTSLPPHLQYILQPTSGELLLPSAPTADTAQMKGTKFIQKQSLSLALMLLALSVVSDTVPPPWRASPVALWPTW